MLVHTSHNKLKKGTITRDHDYFGGVLCFAAGSIYAMSDYSYCYVIDNEELIDNCCTPYDLDPELLTNEEREDLRIYCDLTEDEINDLIWEDMMPYDLFDSDPAERRCEGLECGELGWTIQGLQGKLARRQGHLGCETDDEQGTVYLIDMFEREDLLIECPAFDHIEELRDHLSNQ